MPAQDDHKVRFYLWLGFWLLLLLLVGFLFHNRLEQDRNPNRAPGYSSDSETNQVVLQRNRYGQYHVNGYIQDIRVEFLLDTGASDISVPLHLANQIGLEKLHEINMYTAGGMVRGYATRIPSARIGNIELTDLKANINPNVEDDTVLLGMSFLKQIEFTQREDTLILRQYHK